MKLTTAMALTAILGTTALPLTASAQSYRSRQQESAHRQKTKNDWRNVAIGSGALGLLGLLNKNSTLTLLGAAGAAYAADRYEKDRKSQSRIDHSWSDYSRPYVYRDGQRFDRRVTTRNGHRTYRYVRHN